MHTNKVYKPLCSYIQLCSDGWNRQTYNSMKA